MQKIAVVGLGYVGLPLAVCLARQYTVYGFDINSERIEEIASGIDSTGEISEEQLKSVRESLSVGSDLIPLKDSNIFIVTVPTPVDSFNVPNLNPLLRASELIGRCLKKGDTVIYESTVFPGATEEYCVPKLESESGLKLNTDFSVGYSPERINPGDKNHRVDRITKVVSASSEEALDLVDALYSSVITAGTHRASSIKVAEAAKVIENTQRDVNIALVNELSQLFSLMEISTSDVLEAAATKWNFMKFKPGLVGGHCIGVDPYYLTHKGSELGFHAQVILSGRRINDAMPKYVAESIAKKFISRSIGGPGSREILCLGASFKEDCPDVRNSKVFDLCDELETYGFSVTLVDPIVAEVTAMGESGRVIADSVPEIEFGAVLLAVPHKCFVDSGPNALRAYGSSESLFIDLKDAFPTHHADFKL